MASAYRPRERASRHVGLAGGATGAATATARGETERTAGGVAGGSAEPAGDGAGSGDAIASDSSSAEGASPPHVAWNVSPVETLWGCVRSHPDTRTLPSISAIMNARRDGSQATSNRVPVTRTSNGPASTLQRVFPRWTISACNVPASSATRPPVSVTSTTRARADGSRRTRDPSEK